MNIRFLRVSNFEKRVINKKPSLLTLSRLAVAIKELARLAPLASKD
jgi:hypothetical protein